MKTIVYLLTCFSLVSCANKDAEKWWPRFRGPDGSGVAGPEARPPLEFDSKNLLWETELPTGFSSPVIWEDKIFLTGSDEDKKELITICLKRKNGKVLWQRVITADTIENHHSISNVAQNTVATDGENIIACFGSVGLICYDMEGSEKWKYSKPCSEYKYGIASSPVIAGDKVIYINDDVSDRYLLALNKTTGDQIWKTNFSDSLASGQGGQSTPCINNNMVIVHILGEVAAYSINDGSRLWGYEVMTEAVGTPIIVGDKVVVNTWYNLSEADERPPVLDYNGLVQKYDSDKNRKISKDEFPDDLKLFQRAEILDIEESFVNIEIFWSELDQNHDGYMDSEEWKVITEWWEYYTRPSGLLAINTASNGNLTDSDILWRVTEKVSEVPSPVFYNNRIYMIKDGGFLTCINPETGEKIYQERIGIPGAFIASPVAANGHIYVFGYSGKLIIVKAGDELEIISQHDFEDNIGATPAIIGNTIYIRTKSKLLAFSN